MTYSPSIDSPFYWAQNMDWNLQREDSDIEEVRNLEERPDQGTTNRKNKSMKRRIPNTNYVMSKMPSKGNRLIRVQVFDLTMPEKEGATMSAQYHMTEPFDEIMDLTEKIISKISKKISDNL